MASAIPDQFTRRQSTIPGASNIPVPGVSGSVPQSAPRNTTSLYNNAGGNNNDKYNDRRDINYQRAKDPNNSGNMSYSQGSNNRDQGGYFGGNMDEQSRNQPNVGFMKF